MPSLNADVAQLVEAVASAMSVGVRIPPSDLPGGVFNKMKSSKCVANDIVMTDRNKARQIVQYFQPAGTCLDPCAGTNAFFDNLPEPRFRCEIAEGIDFFDYSDPVDWIITNPPYSIYDAFLQHAFNLAANIVFLVPISKAFKSDKIERMVDAYGGLREIVYMGTGRQNGFPFGFPVGCLHYQRGYVGPIHVTKWYNRT